MNALAPGFVPTESATAAILSDQDAEQRRLSLVPLGRFGLPEEVAAAASWLLSYEASYCTGAILTADGGRSLGIEMHGVAPAVRDAERT